MRLPWTTTTTTAHRRGGNHRRRGAAHGRRQCGTGLFLLLWLNSNNGVAEAYLQEGQWNRWARSGHVALVVDQAPLVEPVPGGGKEGHVANDLWAFDTQQKQWLLVEQEGDAPPPQLLAAAGTVHIQKKNPSSFLFGGWDPQRQGTGGIMLDTSRGLEFSKGVAHWRLLPPFLPDVPTSGHMASSIPKGDKVVLHTHRCQYFVHVLAPDEEQSRTQATTGPCPLPQGLHVACAVGKNMVVFGGGAQAMSNEAFVLDTETWTWTQLELDETQPSPSLRASPCLVSFDDNVMILSGGAEQKTDGAGLQARSDVWALHWKKKPAEWHLLIPDLYSSDTESLPSSSTTTTTNTPLPHNAATLSEITLENHDNDDNDKQTKHYLLAGGPFQQTWNDCFVLQVQEG